MPTIKIKNPDGTWTYVNEPSSNADTLDGKHADEFALVSDIPTSLKNPEALTINSTSYDGSQAVSITGLATQIYVDNKVASMVDSAPETLNTLNELAAALGDDPNFATTVATKIGTLESKVDNITTVDTKMDKKNPTGTGSFSMGRKADSAVGTNSFAMGHNIEASGTCSHAEGSGTTASGTYSHAEGLGMSAAGQYSHAEGFGDSRNITITGDANTSTYSLSEANNYIGIDCFIKYDNVLARIMEYDRTALTITVDKTLSTTALTSASALLIRGIAFGQASHAEGQYNSASGNGSHAEGCFTSASGKNSHAEGYNTKAYGDYSHTEGWQTKASGNYSHAEGYNAEASEIYSHAEGCGTKASGAYSHAEGRSSQASGSASHAEGYSVKASGSASHAEGDHTTASGDNSHAEGYTTTASGNYSHAEGYKTTASGNYQHVQGQYNIADTVDSDGNGQYIHIVGNGTSNTALSNAHTIDWDGNAWFAGDVYIGSTSGTNKDNGSKKLATETYVDTAVAALVNAAPETLDTLGELATAMQENDEIIDVLNQAITTKYSADNPPPYPVISVNGKTGAVVLPSETWTFTLSDGSTVTKKVVIAQ